MTDNVTVVRYNDKLKATDNKLLELMDRYKKISLTTRIYGPRWRCRTRVTWTTCCSGAGYKLARSSPCFALIQPTSCISRCLQLLEDGSRIAESFRSKRDYEVRHRSERQARLVRGSGSGL